MLGSLFMSAIFSSFLLFCTARDLYQSFPEFWGSEQFIIDFSLPFIYFVKEKKKKKKRQLSLAPFLCP